MKNNVRKTNIICTIGPATEDKIEELLQAGMNIARINFSHGGKEEQKHKVKKFKEIRERLGVSAALLLDTQGPEIRIGKFEEKFKLGIELKKDAEICLIGKQIEGNDKYLPISYMNLCKDVKIGTTILLDDGAIELEVIEINEKEYEIKCKVIFGGIIKERKSISVPNTQIKLPSLKEKDIEDILYGIEEDFDFIAASFTRNKEDVLAIRNLLKENNGEKIQIIAKIENQEGIDNLEEIIEYADGVMIARGDLGVEIPFEKLPVYQKQIVKMTNRNGKPVIIATQMLESMINNPKPTRAEISDIATAVYDRTSAIMLSGETATGAYPIKCVEVMSNIAKNIENVIDYWKIANLDLSNFNSLDEEAAYVGVSISKELNLNAIMAYTNTGNSVKKMSGIGCKCPIFAITDNKKTFNQLSLVWNVFPIYIKYKMDIDEMIEEALRKMKELDIIEKGDRFYITGGKNFISIAENSKRVGGIVEF